MLQTVALAWLVGAGLTALGGAPLALPAGLILGLGQQRRLAARLVFALALAAVTLLASRRAAAAVPAAKPLDVSRFNGAGPVRVRGRVADDRTPRPGSILLRLSVIAVEDARGWHAASGVLLVQAAPSTPYDYGDLLEARGKIAAPRSGGSDYAAYLARQGVFAEMLYPSLHLLAPAGGGWQWQLVKLRERLSQGISLLPEPEASLGAGIALGTRRAIDPALNSALTATGTAQIIVASGYNITLVSIFVISGLSWLIGRRQAALLALPAIGAYAVFVGLYPSVVRAAVMGAIVVGAALVGRPHAGMRALILAAGLMTALDPLVLADLSFLLSFAGTAGLFLLAKPLRAAIERPLRSRLGEIEPNSALAGLTETLATTMAASLASLPVILAAFHTLSLASLPANTILFPFVPALMALSALTAVAGALWRPAALVLAPATYLLLAVMVITVRACARLPLAVVRVNWFSTAAAVTCYLVFGTLNRALRFPRLRVRIATTAPARSVTAIVSLALSSCKHSVAMSYPRPARPPWPLGLPLMVAAVAFVSPLVAVRLMTGAGNGSVTALDLGVGNAFLVQSGGSRILIDTGPAGDASLRALDRQLHPWQRSLNLIVLSSAGSEQVGALPSIRARYRVGAVLDASPSGARAAQHAPLPADVRPLPVDRETAIRVGRWLLLIDRGAGSISVWTGSRRFLLSGAAIDTRPVDVLVRTTAQTPAPAVPPLVTILRLSSSAAAQGALTEVPFPLRQRPLYRTRENGDITIEEVGGRLRVRIARGSRLGLFAAR